MAGRAEQRTGGNGGGIPDGMLIGLLAFLLGLTLLAWTATGLAGLFAHGAWPEGVTLAETPLSMRRLVTAPHDLPAAWPNTPAGELSGYGLFWGLFIGELMVLLVLTVFVLGVVARWRAVRARQRAERYGGGEADEYAYEDEPVRSRQRQEPRRRARRNDTTVPLEHTAETAPLPRTESAPAGASTPGPRAEPTTATGAEAATGPHAEREPSHAPGAAPGPGAPVLPRSPPPAPPSSTDRPPRDAPPPSRPSAKPTAPRSSSPPTPPSGPRPRTPAPSSARSSSTTRATSATPRPASTGPPPRAAKSPTRPQPAPPRSSPRSVRRPGSTRRPPTRRRRSCSAGCTPPP